MDYQRLVDELGEAAREAGEAILTIVRRGFEVETKSDTSPVTEADRAAELVILAALARAAPGVPVIAEEEVAAGRIPAHDDTYFLVDPLDGTKEFIRGGDDYTVNIGLIEGGQPKLGVVFAPATGRLHGGCVGDGAWLDEGAGRRPIRTRERGEKVTAVASKSHLNQATIDYLEAAVGACGYVSVGSSLKFCIVAEGQADIYPRAAPTDRHCATPSRRSSTAHSWRRPDGSRCGSSPFSSPFRAAETCRRASRSHRSRFASTARLRSIADQYLRSFDSGRQA